jgi:hypothetical protein
MFCTYLYIIHEPVHFPRPKHSEHGLTNVERVPPVVITDGSVVFLDAQHPAAQGLKVTTGLALHLLLIDLCVPDIVPQIIGYKNLYKTGIQFWAFMSSWGCREKKSKQQ